MKVTQQLQELETLAKRLGVKLSYEPTGGLVSGTGGLCRVRGNYRLIVDRRLKPGARVQVLADALSRFDLGGQDLPDAIRTLLAPRPETGTSPEAA